MRRIIDQGIRLARRLLRSHFVRDTITLQAGKSLVMATSLLSFVLVVRALGTEQYGIYRLALNMFGLLMTLNLSGLLPSTITRLAEAVGAGDRTAIRDLMGFFFQVSVVVAVAATALALLFAEVYAASAYNNSLIGRLMAIYTLTLLFTPFYGLTLVVLQSTRAMRGYAALENMAVLVGAVPRIAIVVLGGGATGLVLADVLASILVAVGGVTLYRRARARQPEVLPTLPEVFGAALRNSPRPYWRFGVLLALDKNLAGLYTRLPQDLLGRWVGPEAAGFLGLGLSGLRYADLLFKGILTNLEVRLPGDAGKKDYVRLEANFRRVLTGLVPIALGVYVIYAIMAPLLLPIVGAEYIPAVPVVQVLCLYGLVVAIGGVFGPLYRTLRLMKAILVLKAAALLLAALPAVWLIQNAGALGGAWSVNLVYALSVGGTIAVVWPRLRRLARSQEGDGGSAGVC